MTADDEGKLLPTPQTVNRKSARAMRSSAADGGNGRRSGGGQSSPPGLEQVVEKLLPTPTMMDGTRAGVELDPEHWERKRKEKAAQGINLHFHLSVAMPKLASEQPDATSVASAGSAALISPSKPSSDTSQQPSSSGTNPASESSPGIGLESQSSETSGSSEPPLLATPQAHDAVKGSAKRVGRFGTKHGGRNLNDDMALLASQSKPLLFPTPAVNDMGAGKSVEEWDAWTTKMKAAHGNGNGHGRSLAIEALRLILSAAASLAKTSPTPESARASKATGRASSTSSPELLMRWDHDSSCWKTSEDSSPQPGLFPQSEDRPWPRSRERWPTSGSLVSTGSWWRLQMWAPRIGGSASSSSLPTPTANEDSYRIGGNSQQSKSLSGMAKRGELGVLPTPSAWLGRRPENATADPERARSRRHPGAKGKRSVELPEALASIGEPTNPPSEDGKA